MDVGAILLAGGRAVRVGGAAKPLFEVGGMTLLDRAVEAVAGAGASPVTVVGDAQPTSRQVDWAREEPPFGGPAAATIAGLARWAARGSDPEWMFLLACDLPRVDDVVARLLADRPLLPSDTDGLCLADESGRPQWLSGLYRTAAVRAVASALPDAGRDAPARALLHDLQIGVVRAEPGVATDIDTWEDLTRARARAAAEEKP
ncbi:molybdenum cofactor guanylyltransferase [Microbacterium sp.]|uniref:molybdenum cofactor guanylyltransferase n=1 Tax=Microbacterium sp. TaxID=51671 RepID=UPI003F6FA3AF